MSKDKSNNITEKELLDYLDGKITGSDANRIERQILNSSFDEEAFEGYSSLSPTEIKNDLAELRSRLESKNNFDKPGYLNIAATIAFLIAAFGSIWFVMENSLPVNEITLNKAADTTDESPLVAESVTDSTTSESTPTDPIQIEAREDEEQLAMLDTENDQVVEEIATEESIDDQSNESENIEDVNVGEEIGGAGQLALNSADVRNFQSEPTINSDPDSSEEEPDSIISEAAVAARAAKAREVVASPDDVTSVTAEEISSVSGTVYYQEDGEPLPGVMVTIGNRNTVTGPGGRFQIENATTGAELDFSAPGVRSKKVIVENPDNENVVLSPQPVTSQKAVILGYDDGTIKSPEPANGKVAFIEYVNNSLQYPEEARSQQIEGVVLLKVTVSSSGSINNIEIKKSLSASCDQEAIRLIQQGPQWSPGLYNGEAVEGAVRIRIIFDL